MNFISSLLLQQYPELIFGFSLRFAPESTPPFYHNMSLTVGDDPDRVWQTRNAFFSSLGLDPAKVALQKQVHSDILTYVDKGGEYGESDAMITDKPGIGLAISAADCTPLFLFDTKQKIICGIHSGWKGTVNQIVPKVLATLSMNYGVNAENLIAYIGPSISAMNYQVGEEVASLFPEKFILHHQGSLYADVAGLNYEYLIQGGVSPTSIQCSQLCTYACKDLLHSYRRDGAHSGRALGVIAMKEKV